MIFIEFSVVAVEEYGHVYCAMLIMVIIIIFKIRTRMYSYSLVTFHHIFRLTNDRSPNGCLFFRMLFMPKNRMLFTPKNECCACQKGFLIPAFSNPYFTKEKQ